MTTRDVFFDSTTSDQQDAERRRVTRYMVLRLLLALALCASWQVAQAQKSFDHFGTGFPLTGAHASASCESCHILGVTKGTPKKCATCHNGVSAVGPGLSHPLTSAPCEACHGANTVTFSITTAFDHLDIRAACTSCHLKDQSAAHIPVPAGADCSFCHRTPPGTFDIASLFNHSSVSSMRCDACHSGAYTGYGASGKTTTHPPTKPAEDCGNCHNTISFANALFDHATTTSGCATCHTDDLPTVHIPRPTGAECVLCHRVKPDVWTNAATFSHTFVNALRCDACHNGAFTAAGALGKSTGHPATTPGQDCNACHKDTMSFANAVAFNHAGVTSGCTNCHLAQKPRDHVPVPAGSECVLCHRVPPDTFANAAAFTHTAVASMRCDACHNGSFTANGALAKSTSHIPTAAGQDCKACHRTLPDTFTTAAIFNHTSVTSLRCDACHSGAFASAGAIGKSTNHPATSPGQDCNACHKDTTSFAGAVGFNHTGVTTGCNGCHAKDKAANHLPVPAGSECVLCHRVPPDTLAQARSFSHAAVSSLRCDGCHNGQYTRAGAQGKPGDHPRVPAGADCNASGCHRSTNSW